MKIKEFIREFGYSMSYNQNLKITIGSYDITFYYDNQDYTIKVYLDDFDGKRYLISILREKSSLIPEYYHRWCENELIDGEVNVKFYDFDIIEKLLNYGLEFSIFLNEFNERYIHLNLSNQEYSASVTDSKYWISVWELIKSQTGIID